MIFLNTVFCFSFWINNLFIICFVSFVFSDYLTDLNINHWVLPTLKVGKYKSKEIYHLNAPYCGLRQKVSYSGFCLGLEYRHHLFPGDKFYEKDSELHYRMSDDIINTSNRMNRGENIVDGQSPWTVFVRVENWKGLTKSQCLGVLISFKWILTAAHCYNEKDRSLFDDTGTLLPLMVYAGSANKKNSVKSKAGKWIPHPKYVFNDNSTGIYDIALIKLNKHFDFQLKNNFYTLIPICLPEINSNTSFLMRTISIGSDKANGDQMQKIDYLIGNYGYCKSGYICAAGAQEKNCQGDSGGPLYQYSKDFLLTKAVLIGILHGGAVNKTCDDKPTYMTWVSIPEVMNWIIDETARQ